MFSKKQGDKGDYIGGNCESERGQKISLLNEGGDLFDTKGGRKKQPWSDLKLPT